MAAKDVNVQLKCPECGSINFKALDESVTSSDELSDDSEIKCSECGRVTTKGQLVKDNNDVVLDYIQQMDLESLKALTDEIFQQRLEKYFEDE